MSHLALAAEAGDRLLFVIKRTLLNATANVRVGSRAVQTTADLRRPLMGAKQPSYVGFCEPT